METEMLQIAKSTQAESMEWSAEVLMNVSEQDDQIKKKHAELNQKMDRRQKENVTSLLKLIDQDMKQNNEEIQNLSTLLKDVN